MKKNLFGIALLCCISSQAQIQSGLITAFKFQGNTMDQSSSAIVATNNGGQYVIDNLGNSNSAISLNGSSYVYFNSNAVKVNFPLTISAWVKINDINNSTPIFTSDNVSNNYYGYFLNTVAGTGQVGFNYSAGLGSSNSSNRRTYVSDLALTQGQWHHVTVVASSSSNISIYIDCQLSNVTFNGSGSTTMAFSSSESRIGNSVNSSPQYMNGSVDELMIWNRALSTNEISSLCNTYLETNENEFVACNLYPNPVGDLLKIEMKSTSEIKEVKVLDSQGRHYQECEFDLEKYSLDLSACPSGSLIIEIYTMDGIIRKKIVKL